MKKIIRPILSILLILSICLPSNGKAQTGEVPPAVASSGLFKVLDFLATNQELLATNKQWCFVPYLSRAKGLLDDRGRDAEWGGGLAVLYPLNNYLRGGFRCQYFAGEFFLPSVNMQLQSSYNLFGSKAVWTPMLGVGVAMPLAGSAQNGDIGTLYLAGLSIKYPITDKWEIGAGYAIETWSNLKVDHVEHLSIFASVKF